MKTTIIPLSSDEKQALKNCERAFRRSDKAPFIAGKVLQRIRDGALYREAFPTFARYCTHRLDCSRSRADRYIGAWRVDQILTPIGVKLRHESQARPLIAFTDDEVVAVGELVLQIGDKAKITAEHVRLAAAQVKPPAARPAAEIGAAQVGARKRNALGLILAAEEAARQNNQAQLLAHLAALKTCLQGPAYRPSTTQTIGSVELSVGTPAPASSPSKQSEQAKERSGITPQEEVKTSQPPALQESSCKVEVPGRTGFRKASAQPVGIQVGAASAPLTKWYEVPLFIANWLLRQGLVLPRVSFIKRNPLSFPASGRPRLLSNGFGIELGDDQRTLLRKARLLRDRSGRGDIPVRIQTSTGETIEI